MANVKDKNVSVESLSVVHNHNKGTYMPMANPTGSGTMTMDGDASISGNTSIVGDVVVGSLMIGSNVKLVPVDDRLEIVFINEETASE